MEKIDPSALNVVILWDKDGDLKLLKNCLKRLHDVKHQVIVSGDYCRSFFQSGLFESDRSLGQVIFQDVKSIGMGKDVVVISDRYFDCDEIRFIVCQNMKLVMRTNLFPLKKLKCPKLESIELKLEGQGIRNGFAEWLNRFTMLKKLKIVSDDSICGFRFLELKELEELILIGESLEFGFFGCVLPKLKKLDLSKLKELMIFLDTKFDILEELNLNNTMIVFPVVLDIPSLKRLNIRGYGVEVPQMKLDLRKLKNLEMIELSTFKYLTNENSSLQSHLKEIIYHHQSTNNLQEELDLLTTLTLPQLTSLTLHFQSMPCYDFSHLSINHNSRASLTILINDPATEKLVDT